MACACGSTRIMAVSGKTSDMCCVSYGDVDYDGYVPSGLNIGDQYGDYIEFDLCMHCGRIQGTFPVTDAAINEAIKAA